MSQNEPNEVTEQNEGTSSKQRSNIFRTTMKSLHNLFKVSINTILIVDIQHCSIEELSTQIVFLSMK